MHGRVVIAVNVVTKVFSLEALAMSDLNSDTGSIGRGVPAGYHTVTPFVVVKGAARFIDFLKAAFGGEELGRVTDEHGVIGHAEVRIGDSVVMLFDARPDWPNTPAFLRLYVEDANTVFERAVAAGAAPVTRVTLMPWGDRVSRVRDPLGNLWWIQSRVEEVSLEEFNRRMADPQFVRAMEYVQSAEFFPAAGGSSG